MGLNLGENQQILIDILSALRFAKGRRGCQKHKQQINISLVNFGEKILKTFEERAQNNTQEKELIKKVTLIKV
jgi:NADH dehydrogenase FAD-containing subunit